MCHSCLIAAPPPTQTVIANAKPSRPISRLSTCFRAGKLVRGDGLDVIREEIKGMRDGPRESERLRAYVLSMICTGCVGSSGRLEK